MRVSDVGGGLYPAAQRQIAADRSRKGTFMSNDYATAWDALAAAIGAAQGRSSGSIDDVDHLSFEQRIQVAQVAALLSISQEISALNPNNQIGFDGEGNKINAWGIRIP